MTYNTLFFLNVQKMPGLEMFTEGNGWRRQTQNIIRAPHEIKVGSVFLKD